MFSYLITLLNVYCYCWYTCCIFRTDLDGSQNTLQMELTFENLNVSLDKVQSGFSLHLASAGSNEHDIRVACIAIIYQDNITSKAKYTIATDNAARVQELGSLLHVEYFTIYFVFVKINQRQHIGKTLA